jgi:hypothetical protein
VEAISSSVAETVDQSLKAINCEKFEVLAV